MDALLVVVFISVLGHAQPFQCPRSSTRGLYPNPEDCSKYYQCVNGGRYYPKNCPPGLWFDSRYSICNWPGYVSCYSQRPQIQPLASEESDPVLSGTIRHYPQKMGRQVHTTQKRTTYRTLPTTRTLRKRTTAYKTPGMTSFWTSLNPHVKTRTPRSPQTERPTTRLHRTTVNQSPDPLTTPQSVLDWLYEDDVEESQIQNVHPQAPPKTTAQANPINNVASMDEYGGFDDNQEYDDAAFDPPPDCTAAFSLELDPTRCEGFYQCYLWIPYPKVCPAGLLFDHQSNVCNWPEYVYCLDGERYDPPETTTMEQIATRPPTPPAPSNNFNPQGNGGFLEDNNNYDDYWPIEDVMEDERHRTAFKNKGLQVHSSQDADEEKQKASTPNAKVTTLMMHTDTADNLSNECGPKGCNQNKVKTSDYKINPKMIKKTSIKPSQKSTNPTKKEPATATTVTTTITNPVTIATKLSNIMETENSSSSESSESIESSSDSNSSSNETESKGSIFGSSSSSEENQASSDSRSSEENNEVIKPQLTSNNFKINENQIKVEIVEVKSLVDNSENEVQMQEFTDNQTTDNQAKKSSSESIFEKKAVEYDSNSTESFEGSGSELVLTKIDILRNSVEQLLDEDVLTTVEPDANGNLTLIQTNITETTDDPAFNETSANGTQSTPLPSTVPETANKTENDTVQISSKPTEKPFGVPEKSNDSLASPQPENTTESNATFVTDDKTDLNVTKTNVTNAAEGKVDKIGDSEKLNISHEDSVTTKNDTVNSTLEAVDSEENITSVNSMLGNVTTPGPNVTVITPNNDSIANETMSMSENSTTDVLTTTVISTSTLPTKACVGNSCSRSKTKSTTTKTKSSPGIARASSNLATKTRAKRPDIVMLSGKSPIARILEKLLNIRMKQIGNNKFKAIAATKDTVQEIEVPSENKIRSSPKSQNDEGRTVNPSKTTSAAITTPKANDTTTAAATVNVTDVMLQSGETSGNGTVTDITEDNELVNVSVSTPNKTDNVSIVTDQPSNITGVNETTTDATTNSPATNEPGDSSNETSTTERTITVPSTSDADAKKISAAAARHTQKAIPTVAVKTSGKTTVVQTTTQAVTSTVNDSSSEPQSTTTLPPNITQTTNSSVEIEESNNSNITVVMPNITATSNETTNSATTQTVLTSTSEKKTSKKTASNKPAAISIVSKNSTESNASSEINSDITNNTTESAFTNDTTTIAAVNTTPPAGKNLTTTMGKAKETKATSTTLRTSVGRTSRKQRETHKPAGKPTHFRQRGNSPHFEARKVFGRPDEKWRFSDGTLVDQFSRQQRDVDRLSETSTAYVMRPSLLLLSVILFFYNQLA